MLPGDTPGWAADALARMGEERAELVAQAVAADRAAAAAMLRGADLARAAEEAAGDLEAELRARYAGTLDYPTMRDRFERDLEVAQAVRLALAAWHTPRTEAAAALLAACRALPSAWDRVCRAHDEFGPESEAYGEASDALDTAIVAVVAALRAWEGGEG